MQAFPDLSKALTGRVQDLDRGPVLNVDVRTATIVALAGRDVRRVEEQPDTEQEVPFRFLGIVTEVFKQRLAGVHDRVQELDALTSSSIAPNR